MTTTNTSWRVPLWAYPWLSAAILAEAMSNALRAYSLGTHLDQFTLSIGHFPVSIAGAVLALAAVAVTGSQARAAWVALTPSSPGRQRWVAGATAALLLSVSISAMVSHLLEAQRAKVADEGGDRGRHDRAKVAYEMLKAEDDGLQLPAPPRSAAEIQADVASVKIDMRIWRASKQCEDITREESKIACAPVLALYKERAKAARRTELAPDLAKAKAELDAAPRPTEASAAETGVAGVWGWLMGFAVVFVATFGSVIFARVDAELSGPPNRSPEPSVKGPLATDFGVAALKIVDGPLPLAPDGLAQDSSPPGRGGARKSKRPCNPRPPNGSPRRGFPRKAVLANLQRQLASGERFESQVRMSKRFGVPKSTLSEWLSEWEEKGAIPVRRQAGRRKELQAA
jgi:hypothetical protein